MDTRTYTFSELKQLLSESASDFKAKVGDGVKKKIHQHTTRPNKK